MRTALQLQQQPRRRAAPSLRQQYDEYILQRIESFKNSLSRREVLDLGDEAIAEMESARGDQFLLTEVLLSDWVDRLVRKRLGLQPYSRWSRHFRKLRQSQREPTRWGIDRRCPVIELLPRLEPGDAALVVGNDAAPVAYLLAAHDVEVLFFGPDMTFVDQVESRVAEEALGHLCTTFVTPLGHLPSEVPDRVQIVVLDTGALDGVTGHARGAILQRLMDRTAPGGVHLILPSEHALAPEALLTHYGAWSREDGASGHRKPARSYGMLLGKPAPAESRVAAESRDVPA